MKEYITGTITGISMMVALFLFVGATSQQKNDSLNTIMGQLDNYVQGQLDKDKAAGRFQLQSFQIERTHWHYMLDTATGQLFRLEPSRTPGNSKWVLTADANFKSAFKAADSSYFRKYFKTKYCGHWASWMDR